MAKGHTHARGAGELGWRGAEDAHPLLRFTSDIFTVLLDADGTIRYESPAIGEMLGFRPEDLIGKNAFGYVHPEGLECVYWRPCRRPNAVRAVVEQSMDGEPPPARDD
jgi:PAS domain S-box-containing protein